MPGPTSLQVNHWRELHDPSTGRLLACRCFTARLPVCPTSHLGHVCVCGARGFPSNASAPLWLEQSRARCKGGGGEPESGQHCRAGPTSPCHPLFHTFPLMPCLLPPPGLPDLPRAPSPTRPGGTVSAAAAAAAAAFAAIARTACSPLHRRGWRVDGVPCVVIAACARPGCTVPYRRRAA